MKNYIAYSENGQILRTGTCKDTDISLQGENVLEGKASDEYHYIQNKIIVSKPQKPEGAWVFDYTTKTWIQDLQAQWGRIRQIRNDLLIQSDWTQMPDVTLSTKELWASYRQGLRDVTSQSDPFNIVWPTPPN